ncbi:MAG: DMT family transporter [Candidatus Korobacteraceae bacterium]
MFSGSFQVTGLSLLSAASWGAGDFSGGIAAKKADVFRIVAVAHAFGLLCMLLMAWLAHESVPPRIDLLWGAIAGLTGAFGIAALYKALAVGRMGIIAPVAGVITATLPVLVGIATLGLPPAIQLVGFALALVSIWLVARPDGHIDTHRGLGLAVIAGICFGLFLVSGKQAGLHTVFWPMVAARAASVIVMGAISLLFVSDARPLRPAILPILLCGLLDSVGNALFIAATRHGRLDVAAVLSSLYPASTVILAWLVLKERVSRMQGLGIAGALVAIALISA